MATLGPDKRLNYYRLEVAEVLSQLDSHISGLTRPEASRRLKANGANSLARVHERSNVFNLIAQFDYRVTILLVATAGAVYLGHYLTAVWLAAAAVLNIVAGFYYDYKANRLSHSFHDLLPSRATIRRSSVDQAVDSHELVLGDIVLLRAGQRVPADVRIISHDGLIIDGSGLTGDTGPARKFEHSIGRHVPLAKRHNLALAGAQVLAGTGEAIVIATGSRTELARQAGLAEAVDRKSPPVQLELKHLATRLGQLALLILLALAVIAWRSSQTFDGFVGSAVLFASALVPSGLIIATVLSLAWQANELRHRDVLVQRLSALDTLGVAHIILADQHELVSKAELAVSHLLVNKSLYQLDSKDGQTRLISEKGRAIGQQTKQNLGLLFEAAALSGNWRTVSEDSDDFWGNAEQAALQKFIRHFDIKPQALFAEHPTLQHWPHDAGRQLASTISQYDHRAMVFVQGPALNVIDNTTKIWDLGHTRKLSDTDRERLLSYCVSQAEDGYQTIALAYRKLPSWKKTNKLSHQDAEQDLTLLGVVSLQINLHRSAASALKNARLANQAVSLISQAAPETALAIARQAKLTEDPADLISLSGAELYRLGDRQLAELLRHGGVVFYHINPEDKWRLANVANHSGHRVVATGYSLADVAAIRHSDVAVASAAVDSAVAQNADIVLAKPSLGRLMEAASEGSRALYNFYRTVYASLTDSASLLILLSLSLALQLAWHVPFAITAPLILLTLLVMQTLPQIGLHRDQPTKRQIDQQFRQLFVPSSLRSYASLGMATAVLALANFVLFFERDGVSPGYIYDQGDLYFHATTLTFVTVVLCQWVNLWLARSAGRPHSFGKHLLQNETFLWLFAAAVAVMLAVIYLPPLQASFNTQPLSWLDWVSALIAAGIYLVFRLLVRHERRHHTRHHVINLHHQVHGPGSHPKI